MYLRHSHTFDNKKKAYWSKHRAYRPFFPNPCGTSHKLFSPYGNLSLLRLGLIYFVDNANRRRNGPTNLTGCQRSFQLNAVPVQFFQSRNPSSIGLIENYSTFRNPFPMPMSSSNSGRFSSNPRPAPLSPSFTTYFLAFSDTPYFLVFA